MLGMLGLLGAVGWQRWGLSGRVVWDGKVIIKAVSVGTAFIEGILGNISAKGIIP